MPGAPSPTSTARPGLSREKILDAAEALFADADHPSFTMRRLADRLGVTPMALYKWFENKDELLDALTDRLIALPFDVDTAGGSWNDRALRYASRIRSNLLEHLPLLQIDGASRRLAANVVSHADEGLELMCELGFKDQDAVDAYRVLFWAVLDFCLTVDATDAMTAAPGAMLLSERVVDIEGEDFADRMPTLARLLPNFTAVDPDAFFNRSMTFLLLGISSTATR